MYLSAIILGLLGSLHCLGMCGPIAFLLPVDRNNPYKKFIQIFIYHGGRLMAYGIMGLLFGLLGKGLYVFGLQQKLSIGIGILLIVLVLIPATFLGKTKISRSLYGLVSKLKNKLGKELQKKTADTFVSIGFLNGFLPCGLVYMALFASIAMASPAEGALYMIFFGLGTVPLMTATVYFARLLKNHKPSGIKKIVPIFVVIIGLFFILRGMGLGIPYLSPKSVNPQVSTAVECVH